VHREADSLYAVLTKLPNNAGAGAGKQVEASKTASAPASSSSTYLFPSEDICTPLEAAQFNDEADVVIVTKRDPDSAYAVKVASMDYVVPEKAPQPKNVLESLVWDREKDVDRMRERLQVSAKQVKIPYVII
jgi:hypothetical protein